MSGQGSPEVLGASLQDVPREGDQRDSVISLRDRSRGLAGLPAGSGNESLQGEETEHTQQPDKRAETDSERYTVSELSSRGFILSTAPAQGHEDVSSEEEQEDDKDLTHATITGLEASKLSNILIRPSSSQEYLMSSSSSDEDPVGSFERQGHQGSYVIKKGGRKGSALTTSTAADEERRVSNVSVTPIATLDQSQKNLMEDFGSSSSDDDSPEAFKRDGKHRSLVLKRAKPKKPVAPPPAIVLENPVVNTDDNSEPAPDRPSGVVLHPDTQARLERCRHLLETEYDPEPKGSKCDPKKCFPCLKDTTEPPVPPQLQHMQRMGFKMAPFFFFPALPKLLQDMWVATELFITFFEFVFACITFGDGGLQNILVISLSLVNLFLATTDGFFYFIESGSCVSLLKWGYKKVRKERDPQEKAGGGTGKDEHSEKEETKWSSLRRNIKKWVSVASEVVRIGLTELLLYPLLILDMYELIGSQTYTVSDSFNRINFTLLIIGLFYLALTVYIIRIFMSISTIVSISRLPKTTDSDYHKLLVKFGLHIIGQIVVHMVVIVMVATKIDSEACETLEFASGSGDNATTMTEISINTSPFLYVTLFIGDLIPFLGVGVFFVVNYPALKEFMMGFCIDMMSNIVSEDFASTALTGKGIKSVQEKTTKVKSTVDLASTRDQYSHYSNVFSFKKKLAYRLTNPLVCVFSSTYFSLLVVFLVCHALGKSDPCDSNSDTSFITFSKHPGVFITFIIGLLAITAANFQVVFMCVIWLMTLVGVVVLVAAFPLVVMLLAPLIAVIVLVKACI